MPEAGGLLRVAGPAMLLLKAYGQEVEMENPKQTACFQTFWSVSVG